MTGPHNTLGRGSATQPDSWDALDFTPNHEQPPYNSDAVLGRALPSRPLTGRYMRFLAVLSLAIVLIGAGAGYVGALLWPPTYAARADILFDISQANPNSDNLREDRSLTTQLVLLRSRQVLGPAAASSHVPVEALEKNVTAATVEGSEVIQVEVRNGSRDVALRQVRAIVDRYMEVATPRHPSEANNYLHAQLAAIQADLANARKTFAEVPVQVLSAREQQVLTQIDQATATELQAPRPQVVGPAYSVLKPVTPRPKFAAAAGGMTGLLIAAGLVAVLARRKTRG